jgi:iron(III) transport system ATP-binding protein
MEALDVVELGAYAGRSPQELSGGQRQRVALARCLVSEPEVVLLDEPLANLDRHLRATMEQTFREFHRRTGATFVYVTHDQAEAMALASHIAVMHQGELMQWGRRRRSISIHKMPGWRGLSAKAAFCRWQPSIRQAQLESVQLHDGLAPDNTQPRQQVLVRPEHVMVGDNGLPAMVESCIFQGERYLLELRLPDGQHLSAFHSLPLREQQSTRVRLMQGWCLEAA